MATNTTKAGLWDLEREDYNDDQNSEKASDNGCADHEYDENDYENDNENDNENDDESSETFRSLPAAPLEGSLTGGRKARTSPLIRSLLIIMMMMVQVDLHIIRLSMICFHHNMKMPVGVGLQADQQGCRGQGGCSWCCR